MRHGIHCFVQKPLTHSLYEARTLAKLAREKKLATQMGNQGSAESSLRKAAALLRAGVLGEVSEIHISTDRPIWPQGIDRPKPLPPPKYLDWDLWLGPAPARPYGELTDQQRGKYPKTPYHPFAWRGWWDFGTGALGDIACHAMNMAFHGLDLRDPETIQAETPGHNRDSFPSWSIITYQFAATSVRPALKLFWYDGGKLPSRDLFQGFRGRSRGCLVVGSKGKMIFGNNGHVLSPGLAEPAVHFPESPGHFEEFVRAVRGGEPAWSNIPEFAGPLTETVLAGNLAVWAADKPGLGPTIEWDATNLCVKNHEGMETLIRREYRKGYEI
jgi:predicted dehydrogenase